MTRFYDLPLEIRLQIWSLTVCPRTVQIQVKEQIDTSGQSTCKSQRSDKTKSWYYLVSPTPVPKVLHICRESRDLYLRFYQRLFNTDIREPRYVWINLYMDIVDVGNCDLELFGPCMKQIRRLQLKASNICESWYHFSSQYLTKFSNVVQYFVVADDGWECWEESYVEYFWASVPDKMYLIDTERAIMMTYAQLEAWMTVDSSERFAPGHYPGVPVPGDLAVDCMYVKSDGMSQSLL